MMEEPKPENANLGEMLSFGGVQFAISIFVAFSSYYMMMFFTDIALIPPAITSLFLFCYRLYCAADTQVISIFINRNSFAGGKYRPYYKWFALPFAFSLAAVGLTPYITPSFRIIYITIVLAVCDLSMSALSMASISMLPYLARDDITRSKFVSFSTVCSIFAFILVGSFMLPFTKLLGGSDTGKGFAPALAILALISIPLIFNAYFRLKERFFTDPGIKHSLKNVFLAIWRSKRIMIFLSGLFIYNIADAFKNATTYFYLTYVMIQPDLLPMAILAGLLTPLAMQPVIPRLLKFAAKETLIVFGLFAAFSSSILMLAAGNRPIFLITCIMLYGVFTAIAANLFFAVMASFSDEIRAQHNISMSEILAAVMNLCSNVSSGIAGSVAALVLSIVKYSPTAKVQMAVTLTGIKALYIFCTAAGLALSSLIMLLFQLNCRPPAVDC